MTEKVKLTLAYLAQLISRKSDKGILRGGGGKGDLFIPPTEIVKWEEVVIDGVTYYRPLYQ